MPSVCLMLTLRPLPGRASARVPLTHAVARPSKPPLPACRPTRTPPLAAASSSDPTTTTTSPVAAFTAAASGEWEGAAAAFNRSGEPVELPPRFVPEAFREWGVEVADWQTQCSSAAAELSGTPAAGSPAGASLSYRLKRLLPSVGCEADATAFVDEGVSVRFGGGKGGGGEHGGEVETFLPAFLADGAYALAPSALPTDPASRPARFEVSLPLPPAACVAADGSVAPRRVRAVVSIAADPTFEGASRPPPILTGVELFSEKRYGEFNGGSDSLAGCGGGVAPFARGERLQGEVVGRKDWSVAHGVEWSCPPGASSPTTPLPDPARGSTPGRLLLPLGAWAAVRPAADGDGVVVEAGVVAKGSSKDGGGVVRRSGAATFTADGTLAGVSLVAETAGGGRLD